MPRSLKLCFFGDSILFGQHVQPPQKMAVQASIMLGRYLMEKHNILLMVDNPSVCGNTTGMALQRMAKDVDCHRPDFVAIQFGMNDCNYWQTDGGRPRTEIEQFEKNLKEIVRRVQGWQGKPWLHTNHPTGRTTEILPGTQTTYEESNLRYNEKIRKIAAEENVPLLDIASLASGYCRAQSITTRELVLDDLLHLSPRGHDFYLSVFTSFARDIIEKAL